MWMVLNDVVSSAYKRYCRTQLETEIQRLTSWIFLPGFSQAPSSQASRLVCWKVPRCIGVWSVLLIAGLRISALKLPPTSSSLGQSLCPRLPSPPPPPPPASQVTINCCILLFIHSFLSAMSRRTCIVIYQQMQSNPISSFWSQTFKTTGLLRRFVYSTEKKLPYTNFIARTHGYVRNDSETHETVLLDPVTPIECVSLSFRTHPCVLAFITHILCINGIEMTFVWLIWYTLRYIFQIAICFIASMNLGETCNLKRRDLVTV